MISGGVSIQGLPWLLGTRARSTLSDTITQGSRSAKQGEDHG